MCSKVLWETGSALMGLLIKTYGYIVIESTSNNILQAIVQKIPQFDWKLCLLQSYAGFVLLERINVT